MFRVTTTIGESAAKNQKAANGNGHHGNGLRNKRGGGGGGGDDDENNPHDGGGQHGDEPRKFSPVIYRVSMGATLAAVVMTFGALTMVYVFRAGGWNWRPIAVPRLLWLSTALIALSSFTFEVARRALKHEAVSRSRRWMSITVALGIAFLLVQVAAWGNLRSQGIYLAGNPYSSFFYLLTGVHALHLLGGVAGASYILYRLRVRKDAGVSKVFEAKRAAMMSVGALYWHSMDVLWIYVFALLFLWR